MPGSPSTSWPLLELVLGVSRAHLGLSSGAPRALMACLGLVWLVSSAVLGCVGGSWTLLALSWVCLELS
jgi:hypothetical protein